MYERETVGPCIPSPDQQFGLALNNTDQPMIPVASNYVFGLNLGDAPEIEEEHFVGRANELENMKDYLLPDDATSRRKILILYGPGGIGKSQLAIKFAKRHQEAYSAIFWLNAKNEETLKRSLASMAPRVLEAGLLHEITDVDEEIQLVNQVRQWLSATKNTHWLLILDNHDDPQIPGQQSSNTYDIRQYLPYAAQGSIIITTRSPRLTFGRALHLQKLDVRKRDGLQQCLKILADRSGRADVARGKTLIHFREAVG